MLYGSARRECRLAFAWPLAIYGCCILLVLTSWAYGGRVFPNTYRGPLVFVDAPARTFLAFHCVFSNSDCPFAPHRRGSRKYHLDTLGRFHLARVGLPTCV